MWEKQNNEEFREEKESGKKTNVCAERNFGVLDYQMKLKPKATDFAIEGRIMFKASNNTARWIQELCEEKRNLLTDVAGKSKEDVKRKCIYSRMSFQSISEKICQLLWKLFGCYGNTLTCVHCFPGNGCHGNKGYFRNKI